MNSDEPQQSNESPPDIVYHFELEPSGSLHAPSSNDRIVFGSLTEDDNVHLSSPPPPGVRAPVLFGNFSPEDIPWQTDPSRRLGSNRDGWWV